MEMPNTISFYRQPVRNQEMEYEGDSRKDKCLKGQNFDSPVICIFDLLRRSGVLKVTSVVHVPINDNRYYLHPNLLCNLPKKQQYCNDSGVATYKFFKQNYDKDCYVYINLENLCVRHSVKKNFNELKRKLHLSTEKFDPFGIGFNENQKDVNLDYIKLCCQAFFEDRQKSEPIVSEYIFNGPADLKIEYWDDSRRVAVDNINELLYVLVRKVSTEQREDIYGIFYDDQGWLEDIKPVHNHHDQAFVFKIPQYKNKISSNEIVCYFQLLVKNKEFYKSEVKTFKYVPSPNKVLIQSQTIFEDNHGFEAKNRNYKRPRLQRHTDTDTLFRTPDTNNSLITINESNQRIVDEIKQQANVPQLSQAGMVIGIKNHYGDSPWHNQTRTGMETTNLYNDASQLNPIENGISNNTNDDLFSQLFLSENFNLNENSPEWPNLESMNSPTKYNFDSVIFEKLLSDM